MLTMLTRQQVTFFETFGYLALPQAIAGEITAVTEAFESVWNDHPHLVHNGGGRTIFPASFITTHPLLSSLIEHPVVCGVLDDLLGAGWSSYGGDGSLYSGDTAWHSDAGMGTEKTITRHIKILFYLDHLTGDSGALRVIPGSHQHGDAFHRLLDEQVAGGVSGPLGLAGCDIPAQALEVQPGDLLVMDHRTKHAAFGGGRRRRMFTINSLAPCATQEQREAARIVLRWYRDDQRINWLARDGWLDWIATLGARGQANHALLVELGREVMNELPPERLAQYQPTLLPMAAAGVA